MPPETLDSLDRDDLKPLLIELLAQNKMLNERIGALIEQNTTLNARIAELEARAGQPPKTPDNPSLPPSRGQKSNTPAPGAKKKRKGRPGGGRAQNSQ